MVIGQIRQAELERAVLVDAAAAELGLPASPSLTALAEAAPAPWDDLLRAHRAAFLLLTEEISAMSTTNRELLTSAQRASREVLAGLDVSAAQTYSPKGTEAEPARARVVDRAL